MQPISSHLQNIVLEHKDSYTVEKAIPCGKLQLQMNKSQTRSKMCFSTQECAKVKTNTYHFHVLHCHLL